MCRLQIISYFRGFTSFYTTKTRIFYARSQICSNFQFSFFHASTESFTFNIVTSFFSFYCSYCYCHLILYSTIVAAAIATYGPFLHVRLKSEKKNTLELTTCEFLVSESEYLGLICFRNTHVFKNSTLILTNLNSNKNDQHNIVKVISPTNIKIYDSNKSYESS